MISDSDDIVAYSMVDEGISSQPTATDSRNMGTNQEAYKVALQPTNDDGMDSIDIEPLYHSKNEQIGMHYYIMYCCKQ